MKILTFVFTATFFVSCLFVNAQSVLPEERYSFHEAVLTGDVQKVLKLVADGADVNQRDFQMSTALHYAALLNRVEIVDILLKNGADPDSQDREGATPLFYASIQESDAVTKMLLAFSADPNIPTVSGITPLFVAARNGRLQTAHALLTNGANPDLQTKDKKDTPLHRSVTQGYEDMTILLLCHGADATLLDINGKTALQLALDNQNQDIANLLMITAEGRLDCSGF